MKIKFTHKFNIFGAPLVQDPRLTVYNTILYHYSRDTNIRVDDISAADGYDSNILIIFVRCYYEEIQNDDKSTLCRKMTLSRK